MPTTAVVLEGEVYGVLPADDTILGNQHGAVSPWSA